MKPKRSLPCSQQPAICLYHEPDESSSRLPIVFKIHFNIFLKPNKYTYFMLNMLLFILGLYYLQHVTVPCEPKFNGLPEKKKNQENKTL
jgi:hypothetical protein